MIGLSLVSQPANSDQTLRRAFEIFDERKEGFITFAEVKNQGMECGICKARNKKAFGKGVPAATGMTETDNPCSNLGW